MLTTMTDAEILWMIEQKQGQCRRHPPSHPLWQRASVILHELYAEMARRAKQIV